MKTLQGLDAIARHMGWTVGKVKWHAARHAFPLMIEGHKRLRYWSTSTLIDAWLLARCRVTAEHVATVWPTKRLRTREARRALERMGLTPNDDEGA